MSTQKQTKPNTPRQATANVKPKFLILEKERETLRSFLMNFHDKSIDIVVAFASKTEDLLEKIIQQNKNVNLLIGTLNHFTDPVFIDNCLSLTLKYPNKFLARKSLGTPRACGGSMVQAVICCKGGSPCAVFR